MEGVNADRVRKVKDQALRIYLKTIAANEREDRHLRRSLDAISGQQLKQRSRMQRSIKAAELQQEKQLNRMRFVINTSAEMDPQNKWLRGWGSCRKNVTELRRSTEGPAQRTKEMQKLIGKLRRSTVESSKEVQWPTHEKQSEDKGKMWRTATEINDITRQDDSTQATLSREQMHEGEIKRYSEQGCRKQAKNSNDMQQESEALRDSVKYTETEVKNLKVSFVGKRGQESKKRRSVLLPDLDEDPKLAFERRRRRLRRRMLKRRQEQQQRSILEEKLNNLSLNELVEDKILPRINHELSKGKKQDSCLGGNLVEIFNNPQTNL